MTPPRAPAPHATGSAAPRVLLLADSLGGGTGNIVLDISKRWAPEQCAARILTQAPPTARVRPGVPVECLPPLGALGFYPVAQLRRLAQVARRVRQLRPDVLHCYFFWSIMYGRALKALGLVPRLVENREDQGFNWGRHEYALLRRTAGQPDLVVCVSEAVRRTVLEREGLPPERVVVIHNGIEPGPRPRTRVRDVRNAELRRAWNIADDQPVVGMVANFNRAVKGVGYFFDAMPAIAQAVPEVRFLLLGRGPEEAALRARARELGVEAHVIFAGFQEEIGSFYDMMDLSVLTSLSEGLSMTLLESMQHGVAVVATAVGGNPELVREGETGYLVPPRDVPAFADRVVALLRDPARRAAFGAAGRRVVEEEFD
ncbi:MAG TPA: glycosyltransferase family 4 protein, partial [Gemmatimonadales bacterium]|nr:glycosyltransferase family 4 protein [Gemmatimonadales bacterium]